MSDESLYKVIEVAVNKDLTKEPLVVRENYVIDKFFR